MLIYMRHGDDRGNDTYRHDRPLNDRGKHRARKKAKRLIRRYGHPDKVFVSPFRRALETLEAMAPYFKCPVEIQRDPRIAQRLSPKQQIAPCISPETRALITLCEDESRFQHRISDHIADARSWAVTSSVWCITHQGIIEEVARRFDVAISASLDFLDHLLVLK